jgi:hypothetical protein
MKKFALIITLVSCALALTACGANPAPTSSAPPANSNNATNVKPPTSSENNVPLATGHSATQPAAKTDAPANNAAPSAEEEAVIPKPLQEKVKQAETKAKAANATPADKVAAAKAFIERGNVFYEAGQPRLYKYALRDFRLAAKLDPTNAEASGKRDQIIQIYQSMNRPVPTLGEEP